MATQARQPHDFDTFAPEVHDAGHWRTGLGPGLVAGTVMLTILLILSLARGAGFFQPLYLIASTLLNDVYAMRGGPVVAVAGLVIHYATSALLGMLFTGVFGRTTMRRQLALGMLYGIAIWALAQFVFLPWLNPHMAGQLGTIWPFFLGHLSYGVMLASAVPAVRDIDAPGRPYIDPLHREVRP